MSRTHEDIQDELLVLKCQNGDDKALKTLVQRWHPRFSRFAWRLTTEREATRDVVQEAWLAIVRGLKRLDDPARFRVWAYRIVRNKCADWIRRRVVQRGAEMDLPDEAIMTGDDSSNETDPAGEVADLREGLAKLPDEQRAMLSLRYLEEMGIAEIARVLNLPQGTVKSRLYHARNRLKRTMERVKS